MKAYLLGIDLGTSACKVSVFDHDGNDVASASGAYHVIHKRPGWAEQDPEEWFQGVCAALHKIWGSGKVSPDEISAIGIDGLSWTSVLIGKDGNSFANTPIWMDTRATDICKAVSGTELAADAFDVSGNPFQASYTTPKVMWLKENRPDLFERTESILQSNGYIAYRLTGELTTDICNAYGWHCFDMRNGRWDMAMADRFGIPERMFPKLYACDEVIGAVTKTAAATTGLIPGTPVVAGGLDAACGTLGAGVIENGQTQEQGGQAGGMSVCLDTYAADPNLILSFHVVPGKWLLQGGTTGGGGVMRWFEKEFGAYERSMEEATGKSSLIALNEIAQAVPAGCEGLVFLPYMSGERTPIWNPAAKGVFYGLDFSKTKGHMVRACMEGTAFALRHNLETAENAGAPSQVLKAMGGSANSLLWTQIKSDVTGKPVEVVASDTATTLGAAILAGVGTGYYKSYDEAVAATVKTRRYHEPNMENKKIYDESYHMYREIYEHLKDLM